VVGLERRGDSALLERDRELGVIDGLVHDAVGARPAVAVVEGPAGIGKTRLLEEARQQARAAGFTVLSARGSDLERELAFGVVRQLFEPVLADPAERARWLGGSAAAAARVFEPPADERGVGDPSFGILYGLYWLTANLAGEGPLLLAIDDLHWCDRASLRFVAYLEPRLESLQLLVATTVRTHEPQADRRLISEIAQGPGAVAIAVPALSETAVAELVRTRLGAEAQREFCAACHRATGGNPLLLAEVLKTLAAEGVRPDAAHADVIRDIGPRAVSHTVLLRLARLPGDALAVATAIAVLGDGAGLPATAALAQLDEQRVAEATRALVRAEILRSEPPLGFVHPLVRDAVYHELSPAERELRHERAAEVLAGLDAAPELVAAHLLAVPSRAEPRVAAVLRDAGRTAWRRGDSESAIAYLRRALAEPAPAQQRPQLLLELGLAEAGLDAPAAAEHVREAYEGLADPEQRAAAARVLARMLVFTGTAQEGAAVAQRAMADLPADHDGRRMMEASELFASAFGADVPGAAARLAAVRARPVGAGLGAKSLSVVAAWDLMRRGGSAAECAALVLEALADGTVIVADPGFAPIVAGGVLGLADRDEALAVWEAAMASGRRRGGTRTVCLVNTWQGWTWLQRGELAEAASSLEEAFEQVQPLETNGAWMAYIAAFLARVRVERGDLAGARAVLARCGTPSPGSDGDTSSRRSRLELLLAESSWEQASAEADEYRERLGDVDNAAWGPWRSLKALALAGLERRDEATALLEEELEGARRWGAPGALGRCLRLLGTVRTSPDLLDEAVRVTDGSAARLERAKALTALGMALRRARQPARAREPLRRGFEAATRCDARPLAELARAELYAAGGRPRREALTGPESLTPSERRVADLAAEGQSNRDIAQALYVTPKTVEFHLTGVYRKLGISSRAALAAALADAERSP
jgi:DNA-binding CsgD family transcriptional regulator